MRRSLVIAGTALSAAALSSAPAGAQGSAVITHGSCATAMGAAGVASPCTDGSAILFNPGALANHGSVISGGAALITTEGKFTYDNTGQTVVRESETVPVPSAYAAFRLTDRIAAGVGVFAPYGLGVEWPMDFEGRFVSYDTKLTNIYVQPTVAFRVNDRISVGVGVDYVRGDIEINQRADLSRVPVPGQPFTFAALGIPDGTDFADVKLEGEATTWTFHVGGTAKITDRLSLGARYLHGAKLEYEGTADFTQVPTGLTLAANNPLMLPAGTPVDAVVAPRFAEGQALGDQTVFTELELPSQLVVGLAYQATPRVKLLFDFQRTGWESFGTSPIDFGGAGGDTVLILDYQNAHTFRFGTDFAATDALDLRFGFIFNTAAERAASVSPLLPEAERNYLTAGLGYRLPMGLRFDAAYQYIDQSDRRGRVRGRDSLDQGPGDLNMGVYSVDAHILSATVAWHFGGNRDGAR
jgi:long-chain fatty acid transport protein